MMDRLLARSTASSVARRAVTPSPESAEAQLIRALHDEHTRALLAYALRLTGGDHGRAEDAVQETILKLSPAHREVIVECFYHGRTVREAAERLGVPVGTVKSRTHYALRTLKLAPQEAMTG